MDGRLISWAFPREPSFDPSIKRMAVHLEELPVDEADFDVWDRGTWAPIDDDARGYERGSLTFELHGAKLRGVWQLVRSEQSKKDWLLIKEPDAHAKSEGAGEIRERLLELGAPKKKVRPVDQSPMLAEAMDAPFSKPGWIFELKYDGYRLIAARDHGTPRLLYRRGGDSTKVFPDITGALAKLPYEHVILDGEVVVLDDRARPSFQRLQKRVQLTRPQDIERAAGEYPAIFYAFDLLAFEEWDLRGLPLIERKTLLKKLLPKQGPLRFCDHVEERGKELFEQVEKMELEGIIAKRSASVYRAGRSDDWLKIKVDQHGQFAVIGYTLPEGHRTGFGALHLAHLEHGEFVYTGRVGGGFAEKELANIAEQLATMTRTSPPARGTLPPGRDHVWLVPEFAVEVRYKEITEDGLLRQPTFIRLCPETKPADCLRTFGASKNPDCCVIVLDAKNTSASEVAEVARALQELCDAIDLPCVVNGAQVLLPLGGELSFDQSRALAELISRVIAEELPKLATIARNASDRVLLDYSQNALPPDPIEVTGSKVNLQAVLAKLSARMKAR